MCTLNAAGDVCENGSATGTIAAGNCACECNSGYEGDACETETTGSTGKNSYPDVSRFIFTT